MSFSYDTMRHKTLIKATVLRSKNLSVTRMEYRKLHQLGRLMLYPTELRSEMNDAENHVITSILKT